MTPTTVDLIGRTALSMRIPVRAVTQVSRHLREAGLFPVGRPGRGDGRPPATPEAAANLIIGVLGASEGTRAAPKIVEAYRNLPATGYAERIVVAARRDVRPEMEIIRRIDPIDIPVEPGQGHMHAELKRSFVGALSYLLSQRRDGPRSGERNYVTISRNLAAPLAEIEIPLPVEPGGDIVHRAFKLTYTHGDLLGSSLCYIGALHRIIEFRSAPELAIGQVADLLAGYAHALPNPTQDLPRPVPPSVLPRPPAAQPADAPPGDRVSEILGRAIRIAAEAKKPTEAKRPADAGADHD